MAGPTTVDPYLMGVSETPPQSNVEEVLAETGHTPAPAATPSPADPATSTPVIDPPAPTMADELAKALGVQPQQVQPPATGADAAGGEGGDGDGVAADATPEPLPSTPPAGSPGAHAPTVDGGQVPSGAPGTPGTPSTPSAPAPVDLNTLTEQMFGRPLSQEEAYNLFAIGHDLSRLTPQQAAEVERIVYGQAPLTPFQQGQGQPPGSVTQGQPAPAGVPAGTFTGPPPEAEEIDPYLQSQLAPIQQQLSAIQQTVAQQQAIAQDAQLSRNKAIIDQATSAFMEARSLTPEESHALQVAVAQSGTFAALTQRHNGDVAGAINEALDTAYWRDPVLREREVAARLAAERTATQSSMEKQRKAASLAPGGTGVPREDPPPTTREARMAAMAAEIANAQAQGA